MKERWCIVVEENKIWWNEPSRFMAKRPILKNGLGCEPGCFTKICCGNKDPISYIVSDDVKLEFLDRNFFSRVKVQPMLSGHVTCCCPLLCPISSGGIKCKGIRKDTSPWEVSTTLGGMGKPYCGCCKQFVQDRWGRGNFVTMQTFSEDGVEQTASFPVTGMNFDYLTKDAAQDLAAAIQQQYAAMTPSYTE